MTAYYSDDTLTLHQGNARKVLPQMAAGSVDCVVTSPPYFGLRDYGDPEQIGLEESPAEYVAALAEVFAEVHRVLADDGTLWLNLGDSYYSGRGTPGSPDAKNGARRGWVRALDKGGADWAKPKDLLGIPWRVAFALQDAGWYLRNAIVWHKPNAMPESVRDRLSGRHELIFLLTRSKRYYFDLDSIREPLVTDQAPRPISGRNKTPRHIAATDNTGWKDNAAAGHARGRNPGDVWEIPTRPFPEAHFATFPVDLPRRCILAGCKPGGTVLDPFAGAGTTLLAAQQLGRRAVGVELNPEYCAMALRRCQDAPLFTDEPGKAV